MAGLPTIKFSWNHQATIILSHDPDGWLDLDQLTQRPFRGNLLTNIHTAGVEEFKVRTPWEST